MNSGDILLVEDNKADVILLKHFFPKTSNPFTIATDGEQASDYVSRRTPYSDRPIPKVIILDLNLPRKNGKEVLSEIRSNPELKTVPVLMVSGSTNPEDERACLGLGADRFIVKPSNLDALKSLSMIILGYLNGGNPQ